MLRALIGKAALAPARPLQVSYSETSRFHSSKEHPVPWLRLRMQAAFMQLRSCCTLRWLR